jgi:hypothetical protein
MLIPMTTLRAIEAGDVTLAFRRWDRARVKAGTRLRTAVGLVEVTSIEPVALSRISAKDARQAGFGSRSALVEFLARRPEDPIFRVGLRHAGPDPRIALRGAEDLSTQDSEAILGRLAAMDRTSKRGPWTLIFLSLIADNPAVRAPDLAASLGWETRVFKPHVRRLKELGLTESLKIGYRISPRGQAVLRSLRQKPSRSPRTD